MSIAGRLALSDPEHFEPSDFQPFLRHGVI